MENKRIDFNLIIGFLLIGLLLYLMNNSLMNNSTEKDNTSNTEISNLNEENELKEKPKELNNLNEPKKDINELNPEIQKESIEGEIERNDEPIFSNLSSTKVNLKFSDSCACFIDASIIEEESKGNFKYEYIDGVPVKLIDETFDLKPLQFDGYNQFKLVSHDSINNKITYKESSGIELVYQLNGDKLSLLINNITDNELSLDWSVKGPRQEKNLNSGWTSERTQSDLYYANFDGGYDYISEPDEPENEENVSWIAYKQQFFSTVLFSKSESFYAKNMSVNYDEKDTSYVKEMSAQLDFRSSDKSLETVSIDFYFLPNDYTYLRTFNTGESDSFDNLVPLGWGIFGWVNQYLVIPVFDFLESLGLGYGLIILAIAIIFKMLLFFPTKKSYVSMAKMRVLKPEIDALNEKYKDKEPMEKQRAQMDLYKRTGVSPLGGCLPMLLQIPILFALFKFFPASIQLRQEGFLWAADLSTYDTWPFGEFGLIPGWFDHLSLFALLMSISTLVQMRFNAQPSNSQMPQLKYIMYIMPVVFFFIMNSYSSGLSYYYLCANIMTFLQQLYIKRSLNDEELYQQLQENKKKPVKKSGFQKRLEEMAKKQQARRK